MFHMTSSSPKDMAIFLEQQRVIHEEVRSIFAIADQNKDGTLDVAECSEMLGGRVGRDLVSAMDVDNDGRISMNEWWNYFDRRAIALHGHNLNGKMAYLRTVKM